MKYGNLYRQDNVILSGTHTHSGLGGYFQYTLFMITSKGYIKPSIKAIVNGIVKVPVPMPLLTAIYPYILLPQVDYIDHVLCITVLELHYFAIYGI